MHRSADKKEIYAPWLLLVLLAWQSRQWCKSREVLQAGLTQITVGGLYGYVLVQQRTRPWERVLGVKQWLDVDALGLKFEQCDPTQDDDASQPPMAMRINSNCVPLISSLIK